MVGQRFMLGFDGLEPSAEVKQLVRDFAIGGVILFTRNVESPEQVAQLVAELQSIARESGHDLPLLVAVDEEGGHVQRLHGAWTAWPCPSVLGRVGSEDLTRRVGSAMAEELLPCGIRWNLAPVVDVRSNPANPVIGNRAFGATADLAARLGAALIEGLQQGGVAACAKHFPGHGDTSVDSHRDLPVVEHPRSHLDAVELPPFRAAIAAGVATVMAGHVLVRSLDEAWPASLSSRVLGRLLRQELGFDGVVVSDDLELRAVTKRWTPAETAVLAAKAGCDILLVCTSPDVQASAIEGMIRATESGEISPPEMDDALVRVGRLRERFLLPYVAPDPRAAVAAAGAREHLALVEEINERASIGS
jgi:beta-N-acetylhexosaminidase